jgi:plastocyanin domain-containing protein
MNLKRVFAVVFVVSLVAAVSAGRIIAQTGGRQTPKVQTVKLTFDDKGYVVTPATVTKGVPVKMEVDLGTVKGCMRTVVIDAFNVKKTVKDGDTTIEFTPTKSGPIQIVCGMNMGKGSFTVVEPQTK